MATSLAKAVYRCASKTDGDASCSIAADSPLMCLPVPFLPDTFLPGCLFHWMYALSHLASLELHAAFLMRSHIPRHNLENEQTAAPTRSVTALSVRIAAERSFAAYATLHALLASPALSAMLATASCIHTFTHPEASRMLDPDPQLARAYLKQQRCLNLASITTASSFSIISPSASSDENSSLADIQSPELAMASTFPASPCAARLLTDALVGMSVSLSLLNRPAQAAAVALVASVALPHVPSLHIQLAAAAAAAAVAASDASLAAHLAPSGPLTWAALANAALSCPLVDRPQHAVVFLPIRAALSQAASDRAAMLSAVADLLLSADLEDEAAAADADAISTLFVG
jgi:hypothetical protein